MSTGFIKCDNMLINMKYIKSIKRGETTEITVANTKRYMRDAIYFRDALDKVYKYQNAKRYDSDNILT